MAKTTIKLENSPFTDLLGMKVRCAGSKNVSVSLKCKLKHLNCFGIVHGGVIFALADWAFGLAALNNDMPSVTMDMNIRYIRPAIKGQTLVAHAQCLHEGRSTSYYEVEVTANNENGVGDGQLIAHLTGNGHIIPKKT